jgi:hypothetical protein
MVIYSRSLGAGTPKWTDTFRSFTKASWNKFTNQVASSTFSGGARTAAIGCSATLGWGGFTSLGGVASSTRAGRLHLSGRGRWHRLGFAGRGRRHLLGLGGPTRRHLLPPPLPRWIAWQCHARTWERRSSWIHFMVTGDGGARVFLVPRLTKFLAVRDLYWQDGEPSGGRSRASEPVSA